MDFNKVSIGTNSANIQNYLTKIRSEVIDAAIDTLKNQQTALFDVFKQNWHGVSEERFEKNMDNATKNIINTLNLHYEALASKIVAVNNAWIDQDDQLVEYKGE